jgi:DNA-binding MarR family transcriptional regulator
MSLRLVPAVHRATHRIGLYLAELDNHDLTQGEAHILALLAGRRSATLAELHEGLAHKRSTLTSILDRLSARGLVTRTVGAADRRTFVITPTPRGRAAAARVDRHLAALERAVRRRVTPGELAAFLKVLGALETTAAESTSSHS